MQNKQPYPSKHFLTMRMVTIRTIYAAR